MLWISITEKIWKALDDGKYACGVFLDFQKAFDSVPHDELLYKLWKTGITGKLWFWLKNYLKNRQHYVTIDGQSSHLLPVISGVPQGSILGPLLFIIYINDINLPSLHSSMFIFADDTKLLKHISSDQDMYQLQEGIDHITPGVLNGS